MLHTLRAKHILDPKTLFLLFPCLEAQKKLLEPKVESEKYLLYIVVELIVCHLALVIYW